MQPSGLSTSRAQELLVRYRANSIRDHSRKPWHHILLRQFTQNPIIYLLLVSALIAFFLQETITSVTILIVVMLVVVVGFIQEYRAQEAVHALKNLTQSRARVYRDGQLMEIDATQIVPEDHLRLKSGDIVPADCVIISGKNISANEAMLTGEAQEVSKKIYPVSGDISILSHVTEAYRLYMGTAVLSGSCIAYVTHTGMNTRLGSIAHLLTVNEKEFVFSAKIQGIIRFMVIVATCVGLASAVVLASRAQTLTSTVIAQSLVLFIALAVSAFPEDLPVVLLTTLTYGARRMAKKNAIVNRMGIIETLGEVTVICSDKTGTITNGEMTVRSIITDGMHYTLTGTGFSRSGEVFLGQKPATVNRHSTLAHLLKTVVLCTDSFLHIHKDSDRCIVSGSATEGALLVAALKAHITKEQFAVTTIEEFPFDAERKRMSIIMGENGKKTLYCKGAPESVLAQSTHILMHGVIHELTPKVAHQYKKLSEQLGEMGMRTIACAYKPLPALASPDEKRLIFLGIAALEDAPHPEVSHAIAVCKQAGVVVKMITGDQATTARTIASQVGITGEVLTGAQLDELTDQELEAMIDTVGIFARVIPEHKLRIVNALKRRGEIVAMTGDGVNDAPALQAAHVGIAMGKNGTEVTRSVADITLIDDNFVTITSAIREGRIIFKNIRKFIGFQLSCNMAELITNFVAILVGPLFGWVTPLLSSLQILFMNLITDNVPAIALGQTPGDPYIMHEKPRGKTDPSILTKSMIALIAGLALLMCLITLCIQFTGGLIGLDVQTTRTTTMVGFIVIQIAQSFQMRSFRKGFLAEPLNRSRALIGAAALSFGATLIVVYTPLNTVFHTVALGFESWLLIAVAGVMYIALVDMVKWVYNHLTHKAMYANVYT